MSTSSTSFFNLSIGSWVIYKYNKYYLPGQVEDINGNVVVVASDEQGTTTQLYRRDVMKWDPRKLTRSLRKRPSRILAGIIRDAFKARRRRYNWIKEDDNDEELQSFEETTEQESESGQDYVDTDTESETESGTNEEDSRTSTTSRQKYFYIMKEGEGDIYKIGNSFNPIQRRAIMQTGNSSYLKLIMQVPVSNGFKSETNVKQMLENNHIRGEFYRITNFERTAQRILSVL